MLLETRSLRPLTQSYTSKCAILGGAGWLFRILDGSIRRVARFARNISICATFRAPNGGKGRYLHPRNSLLRVLQGAAYTDAHHILYGVG